MDSKREREIDKLKSLTPSNGSHNSAINHVLSAPSVVKSELKKGKVVCKMSRTGRIIQDEYCYLHSNEAKQEGTLKKE